MTNLDTLKRVPRWQVPAPPAEVFAQPRMYLVVVWEGAYEEALSEIQKRDTEIELLRDQRDSNLAKEVEQTQRLNAEIERLKTENQRLRDQLPIKG